MTTTPHPELPLLGKTALVTGVSRRAGIGFAVAVRLAELGADVFIHHFAPHDVEQPWGGDDLAEVRAGIRRALHEGARLGDISLDLAADDAAETLIAAAAGLTGRIDILVCNHARSGGDGSILDMTAEVLDGHWHVNARSTLLLTRAFALQFAGLAVGGPPRRPGESAAAALPLDEFVTGRVIWMTSGQIHGAMAGEVAYAASKAALAGATPTVAKELLAHGIILNTVDPGPVNTGYLDPETTDRPLDDILAMVRDTPFGRFGRPGDPARLIGWLATDDGRWMVGQVLSSDGGFAL
ncbi:SDR family oxidoreductase [Cryobacterium melibiosiphilum]|uniref:SDR family oxidoreductase n=1 Tax=Cryobacterium melibiosiphilum TaxID=995039 RepID=A0A3A5M9U4_9MICO|nr:SDR family oxidoreductase [Cryobacterium melibiosiphilum]RJT84603.1 SDR family oxidoreductase [Cryobacterium melibiosiphilum]